MSADDEQTLPAAIIGWNHPSIWERTLPMREDQDRLIRLDAPYFDIGEAERGELMPDYLADIDPVMQRFQEASYDEASAAAGGGRLIGLSASTTVFRGWMRPVGYVVSFALLAFLAITVDIIVTEVWIDPGRDPASQNMLITSLIGLPFGLAGALMLWRLVTTRNESTHSFQSDNESP